MMESRSPSRILTLAGLAAALLNSLSFSALQDDYSVREASENRPMVDANGVLRIKSAVLQIAESVDIPATAAGPLREIAVAQGDMIVGGQVLAIIDDREATFQLQEAELDYKIVHAQSESRVDIEFAKKSQQVAKVDLRRADESNQAFAGVVSEREMDRLRLAVEQSDAELEKIRFEKSLLVMQADLKKVIVAKKKNELERYRIKSAVSGQVVDVNNRAGEWVDIAETVFRVVRLDRLKVEEYLHSSVAGPALLGAPATFTIDRKSDHRLPLNGSVVFVSPSVDPINSTVQVWVEFENPKLRIRPGTRGEVQIHPTKSENGKAQIEGVEN